jgi:hypothetical protein
MRRFIDFFFVLQVDRDIYHWRCAVLNILVLSSGSAAISASATAATAFPQAAAAAAAIVLRKQLSCL